MAFGNKWDKYSRTISVNSHFPANIITIGMKGRKCWEFEDGIKYGKIRKYLKWQIFFFFWMRCCGKVLKWVNVCKIIYYGLRICHDLLVGEWEPFYFEKITNVFKTFVKILKTFVIITEGMMSRYILETLEENL